MNYGERVSIQMDFETAKALQNMQAVVPAWNQTVDRLNTTTEEVVTGTEGYVDSLSGLKDMMVGLGALYIGRQVLSFGKDLIELANVQADVDKRLEATLRATGNAAGFSADQLKYYASELQGATTFGDEAIEEAMVVLTTFNKVSGDTFLKATEYSMDLSKTMGTDLKSAALMVGKALQDPAEGLTAMRRAGIVFSEQQSEIIKGFVESNDLASAQALILQGLEERVGGVARAMASDDFGKFEQFMNRISDFGESFGDGMVKGMGAVTGAITKSLSGMETDSNGMWASINQMASSTMQTIITGMGTMAAESGIFGTRVRDNMRVAFADALGSYQEGMGKYIAPAMFDKVGKFISEQSDRLSSGDDANAEKLAEILTDVMDSRMDRLMDTIGQRMRQRG